jgi:hypothetical protein
LKPFVYNRLQVHGSTTKNADRKLHSLNSNTSLAASFQGKSPYIISEFPEQPKAMPRSNQSLQEMAEHKNS